jgi:hypothetical protein
MLKIFVSDYTHRTEKAQLEMFSACPRFINAPIFRPADLSTMFRPSRRTEKDIYGVASLACLAPHQEALREFIAGCRRKRAGFISIEENFEWTPQQNNEVVVKAWKLARVKGSARAGADISKANRDAISKQACEAIRPFWCMPNKDHPTAELLKAANKAIGRRGRLHYRTAIKHLGRRPIEQANYEAAKKRKERREQRI